MDIKEYIIRTTVAIVAGILATAPVQTKETEATIDVLLTATEDGGYIHENVAYTVNEKAGTFTVQSLERDYGTPTYYGTLEVVQREGGSILINHLPIEKYLEAVVPSEMPASYEMEALKAQAVCARTYAYKAMQEGTLAEYGADVDDTVAYQVYGNQPANERTTQAVQETKGQIITYEGKPITAYFFSTSAGNTSTDEVWGQESAPCLKSVDSTYEQAEPWYRWNVSFSYEWIENALKESGYEIGHLDTMEIVRKSQGGAVTSLLFAGTKGSATVENEYTIRKLLTPEEQIIYRQDGSEISGFSLLPSAYFTISMDSEQEQVVFRGGGYGHGVGLSQNGANAMAKQGYSYEEILRHYYQGFTLERR